MKSIPIESARRIAKAAGATRLVIMATDDDGRVAFTSYGKDKRTCGALGRWIEGDDAMKAVISMDRAK